MCSVSTDIDNLAKDKCMIWCECRQHPFLLAAMKILQQNTTACLHHAYKYNTYTVLQHLHHCTSLQASRCMMLGKIQAAEDGLRAKAYVTLTALRPRLRSPVQGAIANELRQNESRTAPKRGWIHRVLTYFDPLIYRFESKNGTLGISTSDMTEKELFTMTTGNRAFQTKCIKIIGILWNLMESYQILWNPRDWKWLKARKPPLGIFRSCWNNTFGKHGLWSQHLAAWLRRRQSSSTKFEIAMFKSIAR